MDLPSVPRVRGGQIPRRPLAPKPPLPVTRKRKSSSSSPASSPPPSTPGDGSDVDVDPEDISDVLRLRRGGRSTSSQSSWESKDVVNGSKKVQDGVRGQTRTRGRVRGRARNWSKAATRSRKSQSVLEELEDDPSDVNDMSEGADGDGAASNGEAARRTSKRRVFRDESDEYNTASFSNSSKDNEDENDNSLSRSDDEDNSPSSQDVSPDSLATDRRSNDAQIEREGSTSSAPDAQADSDENVVKNDDDSKDLEDLDGSVVDSKASIDKLYDTYSDDDMESGDIAGDMSTTAPNSTRLTLRQRALQGEDLGANLEKLCSPKKRARKSSPDIWSKEEEDDLLKQQKARLRHMVSEKRNKEKRAAMVDKVLRGVTSKRKKLSLASEAHVAEVGSRLSRNDVREDCYRYASKPDGCYLSFPCEAVDIPAIFAGGRQVSRYPPKCDRDPKTGKRVLSTDNDPLSY